MKNSYKNLNLINGSREDDVFDINEPVVPDSFVKLGRGNDSFSVNTGNHIIKAGRGDDIVLSGDGDDDIYGGRGDDHINGGDGDDDIKGGRDDDYLLGGNGDDILKGGRGNDVIRGGSGEDELYGGRGHDTFVHVAGDNVTEVFDFKKGEDLIKLDFDGVENLGQVLDIAQDVVIEDNRIEVVVDDNNTLIVHGLGSEDVPDLADYFIF